MAYMYLFGYAFVLAKLAACCCAPAAAQQVSQSAGAAAILSIQGAV
jgi:hypothetical protein